MGLVHHHPHRWPLPLQPLEHLDFRLLWSATLLSNAGSWMQRVATAWLIYSLTSSTTWLGVESLTASLPTILLLPLGGILADRLNRRRLLVAANLADAAIAFSLALFWWTHTLTLWHILAASFTNALVAAMLVPASQSVLPSVVGEDHLSGAIALNSIQYNLARAIGPAAAGIALASVGPGWCFALNAASFLLLAAVFLFIHDLPTFPHPPQPILAALREARTFLRTNPALRRTLAVITLLAFCAAPVVSMLPAFAKQSLYPTPQDASAYSALLTSFGIGAAAAGILLTLRHSQKFSLILTAALLVAIAQCTLAFLHSFPVALLITALAGAGFVAAMIMLGTALMHLTPDPFRGRISALQQLLFRSAQPLGSLLAGLLATHTSLPATFLLFALALALLTLALSLFRRPSSIAPHTAPENRRHDARTPHP